MGTMTDPRETLLALASEYRHLRSEHGRASPEGSARRRLEGDMNAVSERIERRLADLDLSDEDREAWRSHVHHGTPAPDQPESIEVEAAAERPPDRPSGRRPWPR
jgi:hypothetical protein